MAKKRKIKQESVELDLTLEVKAQSRNDEKNRDEKPSKVKVEKETYSLSKSLASRAKQGRWDGLTTPSERVLRNPELVGLVCHFVGLSEGGDPGCTLSEKSLQRRPVISREWTSLFVPLVRVNKVFWNAASNILWRCMDSAEPFLRILQPSKWGPNSNPGAVAFHDKVTSWNWERFCVYSLKTHTLIFSYTCSKVGFGWITVLEAAKPPAIKWFPNVKHIFLLANKAFAVFVTVSIAYQLESLYISGEAASTVDVEAILAAFSVKGTSLRSLKVVSLALAALLEVRRIKTLTCLCLTIPRKAKIEHLRCSLGKLQALTSLEIRRRFDGPTSQPKNWKKYSPLATETGVNDALCRSSSLESLRTLIVDADIMDQDLVAATLSPSSLQSLQVIVSPTDAAYIVQSLAVHLQRNPKLTSFSLRVVEGERPDAAPCEGSTEDILDVDTIFEKISLLRDLRNLHLEGLPIPRNSRSARNFVKNVLPDLKVLENLTFLPLSITNGKKIRAPRLESLAEIAKTSKKLVNLNMVFLLPKRAPDMPVEYVSKHGLKTLSIRGVSKCRDTDEEKELGAVIDIARYLDIVFPQLQNVAVDHPCLGLASGYRLWDQIQKFVSINQEMRVRGTGKGKRRQMAKI